MTHRSAGEAHDNFEGVARPRICLVAAEKGLESDSPRCGKLPQLIKRSVEVYLPSLRSPVSSDDPLGAVFSFCGVSHSLTFTGVAEVTSPFEILFPICPRSLFQSCVLRPASGDEDESIPLTSQLDRDRSVVRISIPCPGGRADDSRLDEVQVGVRILRPCMRSAEGQKALRLWVPLSLSDDIVDVSVRATSGVTKAEVRCGGEFLVVKHQEEAVVEQARSQLTPPSASSSSEEDVASVEKVVQFRLLEEIGPKRRAEITGLLFHISPPPEESGSREATPAAAPHDAPRPFSVYRMRSSGDNLKLSLEKIQTLKAQRTKLEQTVDRCVQLAKRHLQRGDRETARKFLVRKRLLEKRLPGIDKQLMILEELVMKAEVLTASVPREDTRVRIQIGGGNTIAYEGEIIDEIREHDELQELEEIGAPSPSTPPDAPAAAAATTTPDLQGEQEDEGL